MMVGSRRKQWDSEQMEADCQSAKHTITPGVHVHIKLSINDNICKGRVCVCVFVCVTASLFLSLSLTDTHLNLVDLQFNCH